ncbi:MAG: amidase [Alphaproteobacteria bacterium]
MDGYPTAVDIAAGRSTAVAAAEAALDRIRERDPVVRAWVHVDPAIVRARAASIDAGAADGPLRGVPIGIKDLFDTADAPTERGSPIHRGRRPATDAACVAALRAAGAVIVGKTVTTEFACFHAGPTTNPHDRGHTPGGSSSGSAAAVTDGHVPLALGSQTVGSVIRPAAFCGVFGMKATRGRIDLAGAMPLSPSVDTLGAFARSVPDLALLMAPLLGEATRPTAPERPRLGFCRTPLWDLVEPAYRTYLDGAVAALRQAGAEVVPLDLPAEFAPMREIHRAIFTAEALVSLAVEWAHHRDLLSPKLRELLAEAEGRPAEDVAAARAAADRLRRRFDDVTAGLDAVLAPSAPGEAPSGLAYTGDPSLNGMWTLLHGPLIHVPHGRGPRGLPLGIQLVGRRGDDMAILALAEWAATALAAAAPLRQ